MYSPECPPSELHHQLVVSGGSTSNNPTVLLLHGRGDSASGIAPLATELNRDDVLTVSVQAPLQLTGLPNTGYEWYPMHEIGQPEQPNMRSSLTMLARLLGTLGDVYPINPEQIVLFGFSQGAVMALALQALHPNAVAGVVALSGYFPVDYLGETIDLANRPVFIGHGTVDHIIPIESGRESCDALKDLGAQITYREYQMGHQVSEDEMADVRRWLNKILAPSSSK